MEGFNPAFMFIPLRIYAMSTSSWRNHQNADVLLNQCGAVKGKDFSGDEVMEIAEENTWQHLTLSPRSRTVISKDP